MSYSVKKPCDKCKKQSTCADGMIIQKAVEIIHNLPNAYVDGKNVAGHQGGGSVTLDCTYGFESKEQTENPA